MPVIKTKKALKSLLPEDTLKVLATDANTRNDIPHLCALMGRKVECSSDEKGEWVFVIS
jgi:TusA-related sulfurtransferase